MGNVFASMRKGLSGFFGFRGPQPSGTGANGPGRRCKALPLDYFSRLVEGDACLVCGQDLTGLLIEHRDHPGGWDVEGHASRQWLHVTCLNGHPNSLKDLGYEPGVEYDQALADAIPVGGLDLLARRLREGLDPDARDIFQTPLLGIAAQFGQAEAVGMLLRAGADVGSRDAEGRTALHRACLMGHTRAVKALLEGGASPEGRDASESTALIHACRYGHMEIAALLVAAGADADVANAAGETPRMLAASAGAEPSVLGPARGGDRA